MTKTEIYLFDYLHCCTRHPAGATYIDTVRWLFPMYQNYERIYERNIMEKLIMILVGAIVGGGALVLELLICLLWIENGSKGNMRSRKRTMKKR